MNDCHVTGYQGTVCTVGTLEIASPSQEILVPSTHWQLKLDKMPESPKGRKNPEVELSLVRFNREGRQRGQLII